jgi:hypothetical protein
MHSQAVSLAVDAAAVLASGHGAVISFVVQTHGIYIMVTMAFAQMVFYTVFLTTRCWAAPTGCTSASKPAPLGCAV